MIEDLSGKLRLRGSPVPIKLRRAECFRPRATLDDLLSDKVMAPVLRSAGYEPDEFRENDDGDGLEPGHALIWRISDGS
jgi:hypothetical protein